METADNINDIVSEEIRALMGRRRVSQVKLAAAIGINQATMSRRLSGSQPFTLPELERIAAYFDVPITDLFGGFRTGSFLTVNDDQQELPFLTPSLALAAW